jgi:predicted nucleic acid-binding protein
MILVADCSALVALASCDALSFLDQLFGTVVVPAAVYREAVVGNKPEAEQLRVYLQGRVRALDPEHPVLLDGFSGPGETEAMLLYRQLQASYLLIDDRRGRRMARINNIEVILSGEALYARARPDASEREDLLDIFLFNCA